MSSNLARKIFDAALKSVLPENFMSKSCSLDKNSLIVNDSTYNLDQYKNIYIFGSGKASYTMAKEIEGILKDKIHKGLVISPYDGGELQKIDVKVGSHPIPDKNSIDATKALLDMMAECHEDDLYIFLLSGGSSALMELPIEPITIDELQVATRLMLHEDMKIDDINVVRKHLSEIKGGRLAQKCLASGVVLVISDIIDNSLESIGSAPLYADSSTFEDTLNILQRKELFFKMPESVQNVIKSGIDKKLKESPKEVSKTVSHHIVASNELAKKSAREYALGMGLSVELVKEHMQGEVSKMVEKFIETAKTSQKECIIFGGECTVDLQGNGMGGRNQHAVLLMLKKLREYNLDYTFLSASTDGVDGNSDAAGAVVDSKTDISTLDIDSYIKNFDSYNFFRQTNSLITTGKTGTNVIDLAIIIKGEIDV